MVMGGFMRGLPLWKVFRSEPHTAQASMRTRSSPGPQAGSGTSSRRTSFFPKYTAAFTFPPGRG